MLVKDHYNYHNELLEAIPQLPHPMAETAGASCSHLVHFSTRPAASDGGNYSHRGCCPTLRQLQPLLQWHERAKEKRGKGGLKAQQPPEGGSGFPRLKNNVKTQLRPVSPNACVPTARTCTHWHHFRHILRPPVI